MHHVYPTVRLFVLVWLVVALLSAAYAAWDQFRGNPEPAVMKWGFVLVTLYMGPVGMAGMAPVMVAG